MSLHIGIVMVKSDIRDQISEVFKNFEYKVIEPPVKVESFDEASQQMVYPCPDKTPDIVHKSVCFINGWTVILDPEMVMPVEREQAKALSKNTNVPVFSMISEGVSGSYIFSYTDGDNQRNFVSVSGEIHENLGDSIEAESSINLNEISEDDILSIMSKLGIEFSAIENHTEFEVWELDGGTMEDEVPQVEDSPTEMVTEQINQDKKPWWKFW